MLKSLRRNTICRSLSCIVDWVFVPLTLEIKRGLMCRAACAEFIADLEQFETENKTEIFH